MGIILSSCIWRKSQAPDTQADTKLGLVAEEGQSEAEATTAELQEAQQREQKRALERQINEPEIETTPGA